MNEIELNDNTELIQYKKNFKKKFKIIILATFIPLIIFIIIYSIILHTYYKKIDILGTVMSVGIPMIIVVLIAYSTMIFAYYSDRTNLKEQLKITCPRCRNKNRVNAKFCDKCGGKLEAKTEGD